ncbi:glycoside hydrolase family 78 protein [Litchfieldia salsa]|uniref:alpha-L-rhamnosidase n=1 Tax=Litchfieldia salsa TaxID=930152 RepID=A0A1H0PXF9_9BACI|nr:glycoside hydrolase family 78 protein [Litchfieldia salsa]SDP09847.1 alpha-L-rhamnosidase [Litchfieldia salsa]
MLRSHKIKLKKLSILMLVILLISSSFAGSISAEEISGDTKITNLKVDGMENPLGVDKQIPRFSWMMESDIRGQHQKAYQIFVASSPSKLDEGVGDIWDSGKVTKSYSNYIRFEGKPMSPSTRYYWTVKVWDATNKVISTGEKAWFETGLMETGWDNAEWIGAPDYVLDAKSKLVFNLEYNMTISEGSSKGSLIFGANDPRLSDRNKNNYSIEGENFIKYEVDLSELNEGTGPAKLHVYRIGYGPEKDIGQLDETKPIATGIITSIDDSNKHNNHSIKINVSGNEATTTINGKTVKMERAAYPDEPAKDALILNPLNVNGGVPTFPRLNEIGFSVDANQEATFSEIKISEFRKPNSVVFKETVDENYEGIFKDVVDGTKVKIEGSGFKVTGGNNEGVMVYRDPSHTSVPMLRTTVNATKEIKSARLYATARGIYEFHINGERVGDEYFPPGHTQYDKTLMYQTYDVTDMLVKGENALGAMLSSGWWSDGQSWRLPNYNYYGDRQSLLAKLVVTYEDGTSDIVVTDPDNWQYYGEGPITYAGFFNGEDYDATREEDIEGWSEPRFDAKEWSRPVVIIPEKEFANPEIIAEIGDGVKVFEELTAKSYTEPRPGVFVYDMGVNMVGVPKITMKGERGQKVTLRTGEILYPDLPEYKDMNGSSMVGMILTENLRSALSTDTYILKGDSNGETYQPRFTFHGYRYLEITGLDKPIPVEDVKGVVLSSITELTGSYETSNPLVNQLYKNITRSQLGNFLSIPTDCPQRDEREGWTGDAQVFARTATYNADVSQFFARYTKTLRDSQNEANGSYTNTAPNYGGTSALGLAWAAAGVIVPWETYQQYGDTQLIEDHMDSMVAWIEYLKEAKLSGSQYLTSRTGFLADHLSYVPTNTEMLSNAVYVYVVEKVAKMAGIVGKEEISKEYEELHKNLKAEWNSTYVNAETHKTQTRTGEIQDTQASYSLALSYGVFNEENEAFAAARLAELTKELGYKVTTGFVGTAPLNPALSAHGYNEVAYDLLESTEYPSWLYPVVNGATSIWERWNSYTIEDGFGGNNSMNSFNHYALGAVGEWMYNYSLGIQRDENNPGFKHFILKPTYGGTITYAKGHYDSMYGKIESSWELKNGTFTYKATVPANTTATLYIPTNNVNTIKEGNQPVKKVKGVKFIEFKDGEAVYELESGSYEFRSIVAGLE